MKPATQRLSDAYGCTVHTLQPRALRGLLGIGEQKAARIAQVGRGLLREYEADRERVKTPAKRAQLDGFYRDLAAVLTNAQHRARAADEGLESLDDEDEGPATVPSQRLAA